MTNTYLFDIIISTKNKRNNKIKTADTLSELTTQLSQVLTKEILRTAKDFIGNLFYPKSECKSKERGESTSIRTNYLIFYETGYGPMIT